MAPLNSNNAGALFPREVNTFGNWRNTDNPEAYVVESWGEGFMFGALLIMSCITISNMRRGVLLHKLILLELLLAMTHGTFCFFSFSGYGWYLSSTAALLYCSYFTHNVVAWMKIRPFFSGPQASFRPSVCKWVTRIYLSTLALTAGPLIFQIYNNFRFFNNISRLYEKVRPYEPLMRDPWWIFSCLTLFHVTRKCYSLKIFTLVRKSPRFGILLLAILLAISFTLMDILASIVKGLSTTDGINPYWKLALVFKCLTDNIMLDDFKSVLQRLGALKLDGTHAMQTNSLNMSPNEKATFGGDDEEQLHIEHASISNSRPSSESRMQKRTSLSGRLLDAGETLDSTNQTRRKQSVASSTVGKLGVKTSRLPGLGFLKSEAEKEAKRNMERNQRMSASNASEKTAKEGEPEPEPWEQVDFITALVDLEDEAGDRGMRKGKKG